MSTLGKSNEYLQHMDRVKRIWYLSPMQAAKVQASLRIWAVSPEPSLLPHTSSESRGTFRQKAISLAPLNGWACTVKICHGGMLEDTNSLDGAHMFLCFMSKMSFSYHQISIPLCNSPKTLTFWYYHTVMCRTPEREVRGSRPTAAVLCPWARHFTPRKYWLITQEAVAPSRYDWKIVDWDVKPQHKQTNKTVMCQKSAS